MKTIQPRPYKLFNKIQNYEWGRKNENAFIPKFLGFDPLKDLPYGELWIGAHPKASSEIEIEDERIKLNEVIEQFPIEILGAEVSNKYYGKLPFLLKILSAAQALSIQLHPNKKQAEILHKKDPKNYPDDNHKPEIAIAIDELTAIAGFRPCVNIKENLKKYVELKDFIGIADYDRLVNCSDENDLHESIKKVYTSLMRNANNQSQLDVVIQKLVERIESVSNRCVEEEQFLTQQKLYGNDVGLLSLFFFNIIQLKPGQAIFTDAGVPHAYLKGNIIECMANSDNVVRAGLTPKFKDVNTLLEIMDYTCDEFNLINKEQRADEFIYKTSAKEFEVSAFKKKSGTNHKLETNSKPIVILIENGKLRVDWQNINQPKEEIFKKGESILCPAILNEFMLTSEEDSQYYIVKIPD